MTEYDSELGKITDQDREYAGDLIFDYSCVYTDAAGNEDERALQVVAEWIRKVRYEAVMADRRTRGEPAPENSHERRAVD